ncbi:MAG: hypothetical protein ABFD50_02440 [Smithella sp.]
MKKNNMENVRQNKEVPYKLWIFSGAVAVIILILISLYFFRPQVLENIAFNAGRIKNTISYYLLHGKLHFYYLEM